MRLAMKKQKKEILQQHLKEQAKKMGGVEIKIHIGKEDENGYTHIIFLSDNDLSSYFQKLYDTIHKSAPDEYHLRTLITPARKKEKTDKTRYTLRIKNLSGFYNYCVKEDIIQDSPREKQPPQIAPYFFRGKRGRPQESIPERRLTPPPSIDITSAFPDYAKGIVTEVLPRSPEDIPEELQDFFVIAYADYYYEKPDYDVLLEELWEDANESGCLSTIWINTQKLYVEEIQTLPQKKFDDEYAEELIEIQPKAKIPKIMQRF